MAAPKPTKDMVKKYAVIGTLTFLTTNKSIDVKEKVDAADEDDAIEQVKARSKGCDCVKWDLRAEEYGALGMSAVFTPWPGV